VVRVLLITLVALTGLGIAAQPAVAAADISVEITRLTPVPAASGADIVYELRVQCSAVDEPECVNLAADI
jgi:hypothetical protein